MEHYRPLQIAIVDAHDDVGDSLAELIRLWGYQAETFATGLEALSFGRRREVDVVMVELALPDMDGCEFTRQFRELSTTKHPFFITVTSSGEEEDRYRSRKAGIDLHLVKPVEPAQLHGVLKRFAGLLDM